VQIGGRVAEANLIRKVQPVYPPLAKSARVQGTVEFTATISKEGNIENLTLVRGHPLLVNAAREAVLQWKYRPTLLNGQPVEVITDIIVNFTLSQ
jgi:protein TonB